MGPGDAFGKLRLPRLAPRPTALSLEQFSMGPGDAFGNRLLILALNWTVTLTIFLFH